MVVCLSSKLLLVLEVFPRKNKYIFQNQDQFTSRSKGGSWGETVVWKIETVKFTKEKSSLDLVSSRRTGSWKLIKIKRSLFHLRSMIYYHLFGVFHQSRLNILSTFLFDLPVILLIAVKQIHFVSQSPNLTRFKSFLQYLTLHVSIGFKYFPLTNTSKLSNDVDLIVYETS